ncbi:MAG: hypothetical protein AB7S44_01520 [Spirochaetales bacterium]
MKQKKCERCGGTDFEFVAEDHYVKYVKPKPDQKIVKGFIVMFSALLILLIYFISGMSTDEMVPYIVIAVILLVAIIALIMSLYRGDRIVYKEKRKTVAICKNCWHKTLVEDEEEEREVETNKIFFADLPSAPVKKSGTKDKDITEIYPIRPVTSSDDETDENKKDGDRK